MNIRVDMDGTLCKTNGADYENAVPFRYMISIVRDLYRQGHRITIWTARGSTTGKDWREITRRQLVEWNVPYDYLSVGTKPEFDLLIDDKALHPVDLFEETTWDRLKLRESK
jgi:hypothetical protein